MKTNNWKQTIKKREFQEAALILIATVLAALGITESNIKLFAVVFHVIACIISEEKNIAQPKSKSSAKSKPRPKPRSKPAHKHKKSRSRRQKRH